MQRGISQTGISIFRNCPYAYKLKYIDRCDAMFYNHDVLDIGGTVHDVIDRYYKNHYISDGTSDDILEKTYGHLREVWDTTLPADDLKKAFTCLQNHANWEEKNIQRNIGTKPLTEVKINARGYFGIIDYIDIPTQRVIDWKTGRKAYLSYEYRMQAYVYKELYEEQFKEKLKHFYFFFLFPDEWRKVKFDDIKQRKVGEDVENLRNAILDSIQNEEFAKEPRTDKGCRSCDYRFYCKFGGGE